MIGQLIRGRRTNYVRVDHRVLGTTDKECPFCLNNVTVQTILEPGNLFMCTICSEVTAR